MKLRYFCFFFIGILIFFISGCGKKEEGDNGEISSIFPLSGFGIQGNQIVYFENGLLEYEDLSVGRRIVLCSKANCKHEGYNYFTNSRPTCEAAVPEGCYYYQAAGMYDGYVYQFLDTANANETIVYKSKINNAGREKVAVVPYTVCKEAGVYLYNGYIYMTGRYDRIEQEENTVVVEEPELVLLQIDMKNGEVRELSNTFSDEIITQINKCYLDDNRLFFEYTHLKANVTLEGEALRQDWSQLLDHELYYIDLDGAEQEEAVSGYDGEIGSLLWIEHNQIYYLDKGSIMKMDCDSGEKEIWLENGTLEKCIMCSENQVIYEATDGKVHYYDKQSTTDKVVDNAFPGKAMNGYVYLEKVEEPENITYYWMSMDDYLGESMAVPSPEPVGQETESMELTNELYDERWQGKKQVIWINELTTDFDTDIIVRLNDILVERGYDFVIRYREEDTYSDDFLAKLEELRASGEAVDLFNIGGVYEGDKANRYEECVSMGLLCSWDAYLQTEEGKALKEIFPAPVWDAMRIEGSIYSYDWRTLPCKNINGYINQNYAEEYHITGNTTLKELEEIVQTIPEREGLQIICADSGLAGTWNDNELQDFILNSGIPVKEYHEVNWDLAPEFFMVIQSEDFITSSDTRILLGNQNYDIVKMKLADGELCEVTNNLLGIASWSENQNEAFTFVTLVNTDEEIANLLQYGIEGRNYEVENGVVRLINQKTGLGEWTISNKRISLRQGMEPEGKAEFYKKYLEMLLNEE